MAVIYVKESSLEKNQRIFPPKSPSGHVGWPVMLKPWQNKKGRNVSWDAPMFVCFLIAAFYALVEIKNSADEKSFRQMQELKTHKSLEHPNKRFSSSCFVRALDDSFTKNSTIWMTT